MSWLPNPIACDVCGIVKQPSNHWWYAEIRPISEVEGDAVFYLLPWGQEAEDRSKPYVHLCGQVCAVRKLAEFMSPPPPPPNRQEPSTEARIQQPEERCSDCKMPFGEQHKPSCHRQGLVTTASDYSDPQWTQHGPIAGTVLYPHPRAKRDPMENEGELKT
jgi:hypothetical protein